MQQNGLENPIEMAFDRLLALKISILCILAALSAIFSGLNLGLMCLDANQLQLLTKAATYGTSLV